MKTTKLAAAAVALALAIGTAHAAFTSGMTQAQIQTEITAQMGGNQSVVNLETIAKAALAAGLDAATVTRAMVSAASNDADAVTAMINAGLAQSPAVPSSTITAAARAAGASTDDIDLGLLASLDSKTAGLGAGGPGPNLNTPGISAPGGGGVSSGQ